MRDLFKVSHQAPNNEEKWGSLKREHHSLLVFLFSGNQAEKNFVVALIQEGCGSRRKCESRDCSNEIEEGNFAWVIASRGGSRKVDERRAPGEPDNRVASYQQRGWCMVTIQVVVVLESWWVAASKNPSSRNYGVLGWWGGGNEGNEPLWNCGW